MDINITNNIEFNPSQPERQQVTRNDLKPIAAAADADLRAEAQQYIEKAIQLEITEKENTQRILDMEELDRQENIRKAAENILNFGI